MDLTRHKILRLGAGVALLSAVSRGVSALDYPTRPVRILVGFAAGSAFDILARLIAQWLSEWLGQPFVVENRSGAAGSVATEAVARARPDGYALLITGSPDAINATLYDNLSFKFVQDIAPVSGARPMLWWCILLCQLKPFQNSLPTPRLIRARLVWRRPASAAQVTCPVSCSR